MDMVPVSPLIKVSFSTYLGGNPGRPDAWANTEK